MPMLTTEDFCIPPARTAGIPRGSLVLPMVVTKPPVVPEAYHRALVVRGHAPQRRCPKTVTVHALPTAT